MKNIEEFSGKGSGEWTSRQKKRYNKKSNRTQQKNKTGESKAESNDSPEVPDGGETSDIPSLPSGLVKKQCPPAQVHCTKHNRVIFVSIATIIIIHYLHWLGYVSLYKSHHNMSPVFS